MSFTVGQLAKLAGLSIRSLHHYDEIGLLRPSERSEAGYRLYSESDVERLNRIQALRWLDLPLSEVKEALDRGGSAVPELVSRKIDVLTQQIDAATDQRTRLLNLQTQVLQGQVSGTDQLLSAVELYQRYEKHFAADDLDKFKQLSAEDNAEWRRVVDDVGSALARNVSPESDEAQDIIYRWGVITYKLVDGDLSLAYRAKAAYEGDEDVRRSLTGLYQMDPAVMPFLLAASNHSHLKILAQYFERAELARLKFSNENFAEWMRIVGALKAEHANPSQLDGATLQSLAAEWSTQLDESTGGDVLLKAKLLDALRRDPHLQKRWLVTTELIDFVERARTPNAPA